MKQIKLNALIVIDYENEEIGKVEDVKWVNGINQILQEELKFELDDIDPKAKITIETIVQQNSMEDKK